MLRSRGPSTQSLENTNKLTRTLDSTRIEGGTRHDVTIVKYRFVGLAQKHIKHNSPRTDPKEVIN